MNGPVARTYKPGSIIYFENDAHSDEIYVLNQGRVVLISTDIVSGEEVKEEVGRGEFFGVKSALGRYPREETAQVVGNSVLLVFKLNAFEQLAMANIPLTMKMLKVFSRQLRGIHRDIRELLGQREISMPATELLNVGEYFFKNNNMDHAIYTFEAYIRNYPTGKFIDRARQLLDLCRKGAAYPAGLQDLKELEMEAGVAGGYEEEQSAVQNLADTPSSTVDDRTPAQDTPQNLTGVLYEGINAFSRQDYQLAAEKYQEVLSVGNIQPGEERQAYEKAAFELGRAYLGMGQMDQAIEALAGFLKKFPYSDQQNGALFQMATIYEKKGETQKAVSFYKKVVDSGRTGDDVRKAKERLKKLV